MIIKSGGNLKLVLRWLTFYMKENIKPGGAWEIVPNLFCKRWWFESTSRGSIQSDFQVIVGLQLVFEDNWLKYLQNKHIWRKTLNLVEKKWWMSHPRMSKHLKSSSVRCSLTVKCWTPLHGSLNLRSHFCFNKNVNPIHKLEKSCSSQVDWLSIWHDCLISGYRGFGHLVRDLPPRLVWWQHTKSHMPR